VTYYFSKGGNMVLQASLQSRMNLLQPQAAVDRMFSDHNWVVIKMFRNAESFSPSYFNFQHTKPGSL
jgi:hypothetical protein